MSETANALLQQALDLPADERYQIAQRLLDSLEAEDLLPDDPAFWEEIARRSDEAHAHPERLIDAKQAIADMRAELARRRAARTGGEGA
jgi:hypothetical protein